MKPLFRQSLLLAALALAPFAQAANHDTSMPSGGAGKLPVACSNVAQDEAAIAAAGGNPSDFWEGVPLNGQLRYLSQILTEPSVAIRYDAPVPDDTGLYPQYGGVTVPYVAIVCHPTSRSNTDADYLLPGGSGIVVPKMQRAGTAPKLISEAELFIILNGGTNFVQPPSQGPARLPLVVFSHGLGGSPLGGGHLQVLVELAAHGYVVGAVFHGDARFSKIRVEDLTDLVTVVRDFGKFVEMELQRPVALKSFVDVILANPGYSPAIDPARIGGFGASMGGQAMINLLGAKLTTSIALACRDSVHDPRVKAAVGYVPYGGQSFLPSFCNDQSGAADVATPFLAISGTADTTAPLKVIKQAVNRFGSSHYMVELEGGKHEFLVENAGDIITWTTTFLNAYLGNTLDAGAMARLIRMKNVTGGAIDALTIDVHRPTATGVSGEAMVMEYYNPGLDHFFIAAGADEIAYIDAGGAGPGWARTGESFRAARTSDSAGMGLGWTGVCRFYGRPAGGPNSHFFTVDPQECAIVKAGTGWFYEGIGFYANRLAAGASCADGQIAVNRAYNNGFARNDSNHRFTTSNSNALDMARSGWALEGPVMCVAP
jgi:predicted dienelactone hydrolase